MTELFPRSCNLTQIWLSNVTSMLFDRERQESNSNPLWQATIRTPRSASSIETNAEVSHYRSRGRGVHTREVSLRRWAALCYNKSAALVGLNGHTRHKLPQDAESPLPMTEHRALQRMQFATDAPRRDISRACTGAKAPLETFPEMSWHSLAQSQPRREPAMDCQPLPQRQLEGMQDWHRGQCDSDSCEHLRSNLRMSSADIHQSTSWSC